MRKPPTRAPRREGNWETSNTRPSHLQPDKNSGDTRLSHSNTHTLPKPAEKAANTNDNRNTPMTRANTPATRVHMTAQEHQSCTGERIKNTYAKRPMVGEATKTYMLSERDRRTHHYPACITLAHMHTHALGLPRRERHS